MTGLYVLIGIVCYVALMLLVARMIHFGHGDDDP